MTQSNSAEDARVQRAFAVILTGYDSKRRVTVLKAVREAIPGSLAKSVALLNAAATDPAGRVVAQEVPESTIETILAMWEAAGARVHAVDIPLYNQRESITAWQDQQEKRILSALEIPLLAPHTVRGPIVRALFQPSFHAYTCVTIRTDEYPRTAEIIVAREDLQRSLRPKLGNPGPFAAVAHREQNLIPADAFQRFRMALADLTPELLPDTLHEIGLDGISILGEIANGSTMHRFHTWSPRPGQHPAHYRFCRTILDLALACSPTARSQQALHDILCYLQ